MPMCWKNLQGHGRNRCLMTNTLILVYRPKHSLLSDGGKANDVLKPLCVRGLLTSSDPRCLPQPPTGKRPFSSSTWSFWRSTKTSVKGCFRLLLPPSSDTSDTFQNQCQCSLSAKKTSSESTAFWLTHSLTFWIVKLEVDWLQFEESRAPGPNFAQRGVILLKG